VDPYGSRWRMTCGGARPNLSEHRLYTHTHTHTHTVRVKIRRRQWRRPAVASAADATAAATVHAQRHLYHTHAVYLTAYIMIAVYECGVDGTMKNRMILPMCVSAGSVMYTVLCDIMYVGTYNYCSPCHRCVS